VLTPHPKAVLKAVPKNRRIYLQIYRKRLVQHKKIKMRIISTVFIVKEKGYYYTIVILPQICENIFGIFTIIILSLVRLEFKRQLSHN
jgi:hypothetical protein